MLLLLAGACKRETFLEFADGLVLNVNTNILKTPLVISFVNANPNSGLSPNNITVDVLGEGADKLYSLTGESTITVIEGIVNIGIRPADAPSVQNPLEFTLIAKAPGFLQSVNHFTIFDADLTQHVTVYMVEKDHAPAGISVDRDQILDVQDGGLDVPFVIESNVSSTKKEKIQFFLPQGVQLLDRNFQPLNGSGQIELAHFDNRSPFSLDALTGMTDAMPAVDQDGKILGTVSFDLASLYSIEMTVGSQEVRYFSEPAVVTLTLNPQTFNPQTNDYIKAGDILPVWSLDETAMQWHKETLAEVVSNNGGLEVTFEQTHLSNWLLGGANDLCTAGTVLTVQTGIPAEACDRYYYVELVDIATGQPVASRWSNTYFTLATGSEVPIFQAPAGKMTKLRVWEGTRRCQGSLLAESAPFDPCGGAQTITLGELKPQGWFNIDVSISAYCETAGPGILIAPTANLLYRPSGCGNFGFLGKIVNGKGCTATLKKGETYDFKTRYGQRVYVYEGIVMEDQEIVYTLQNGDPVNLRLFSAGNKADLILENVPVPADYCQFFEE